MRGEDFLKQLNEMDSDLLVEAEEYRKEGAVTKKNSVFIKFAGVAAMVAVFVAGVSISTYQTDKSSGEKAKTPLTNVEQEGAGELGERNIFFAAKADGSGFTEEENNAIRQLDGVKRTEYQGGACRVNYFYREGTDYTEGVTDDYDWEGVHIKFDSGNNHYIAAGSGLSLNDLSCGRLPQGLNEIVLYSSDEDVLDKTLNMYFLSSDLGGYSTQEMEQFGFRYGNLLNSIDAPDANEFFGKEMKIVGILQEPTEQIYFSDAFCEMAAKSTTGLGIVECEVHPFETDMAEPMEIIEVDEGEVRLCDGIYDTAPWEDKEYAQTITYPESNAADTFFLYMDENLKGNEVCLGKDGLFYMAHSTTYSLDMLGLEAGDVVPQEYFDRQVRKGYYSILELLYYFPIEQLPQEVSGYKWYEDEGSVIKMRCMQKIWRQLGKGEPFEQGECVAILNMAEENAMSGIYTMGVSEDLFNDIYDFDESVTIAVYMEDGQEEKVKEQLAQMGYVEYRFPSGEY